MQNKKSSLARKSLIGTLMIATTFAMAMPPQAWAMLAPAEIATAGHEMNAEREADLRTVQTVLESKMIRQRLLEFKLTPEQINQRLSRLSDAEVHQMAKQIRTINPGGDGGVGLVIGLVVVGILVLLFVYLLKRV